MCIRDRKETASAFKSIVRMTLLICELGKDSKAVNTQTKSRAISEHLIEYYNNALTYQGGDSTSFFYILINVRVKL